MDLSVCGSEVELGNFGLENWASLCPEMRAAILLLVTLRNADHLSDVLTQVVSSKFVMKSPRKFPLCCKRADLLTPLQFWCCRVY